MFHYILWGKSIKMRWGGMWWMKGWRNHHESINRKCRPFCTDRMDGKSNSRWRIWKLHQRNFTPSFSGIAKERKKPLQVSDCVGDHTTIWQLGTIATHENLFAGSFSFPSLPKSSSHTFWGGVKDPLKAFSGAQGVWKTTLPKFNSSPLKSYQNPNRKGSSSNHHLSGAMFNFLGCRDWSDSSTSHDASMARTVYLPNLPQKINHTIHLWYIYLLIYHEFFSQMSWMFFFRYWPINQICGGPLSRSLIPSKVRAYETGNDIRQVGMGFCHT